MTVYNFLRSNRIIVIAIILSQILFMSVVSFLYLYAEFEAPSFYLIKTLLPFATILTVAGVWGSNFFYKKKLSDKKELKSISEKLVLYRSALILRYTLLNGPSFACIVFYFMTGRLSFILFSILLVGIQIINFPKIEKIIFDLELNYEEQKFLKNPDSKL